jgi:hypothetical protein
VIRVYAFVSDLRAAPEDVRIVDAAGVRAAVGDDARGGDALAHGRIVEQLREQAEAVLPVRFGQTFHDEAAFAAAVQPHAASVRRRLDAVRGCVELAVRVAGSVDEEPRAGGGRAYLEARLAPYRLRSELERELHEPLARRARATHVTPFAAPPLLLDAAYLVAAGEIQAFADDVAERASRWPALAVSCTGPWAPYSFSEEQS